MKRFTFIPAAIALSHALLCGGMAKAAPGSLPARAEVTLRCQVQAFEPGAPLQRILVVNDGETVVPQETAIRFSLRSAEHPPAAAFARAPRPLRPGGELVVKDWFVAAEKVEACEAWFMAPVLMPYHPGL